MATDARSAPPGPRGLPVIGLTLDLLRDALGLMTRAAREYGDVVRLAFGPRIRYLLSRPDYIEQVLVVQQQKFSKGIVLQKVAKRLLGEGLLTSEGEHWRRQRRLAQPAFHRTRIAGYAETMVETALRVAENWRDGEVRDIVEEMMRLTLRVAVKTLFGVEVSSEAREVGEALGIIMRYDLRRLRSPVKIPQSWPTPANRRASRAYDFLEQTVYRIIEEKRVCHEGGSDLLSMLLHAMDEDGSRMTPQQVRDETMTLFIAGHETTALATAWTWYLLAQNPHAEQRLHDELAATLGGRPPSAEDLDRLPYTQAVIQESLRLYPPAYAIGRTSLESVEIGGYQFPPGTTFLMSQWVMHRDPRYFDDPLEFRPERWLDGLAERLPAYAYFPFGGGPRRCIGQGFALMEAGLVVATLAQRYFFRLEPSHPVAPEPLVTLRPKYGIKMLVHERC